MGERIMGISNLTRLVGDTKRYGRRAVAWRDGASKFEDTPLPLPARSEFVDALLETLSVSGLELRGFEAISITELEMSQPKMIARDFLGPCPRAPPCQAL